MNRSVAHLKPAFLPRLPVKLSETFRMFWEDSGSEDLAAYKAIVKCVCINKIQRYYHALTMPVFS